MLLIQISFQCKYANNHMLCVMPLMGDESINQIQQESLAKAKVSARQQCVYEDQFCHLTVV